MNTKKHFYSNGKLLLTGEYTVLDGARALALPTTFGQHMEVEQNNTETVSWKGYDSDGSVWVDVFFTFRQIALKEYVPKNVYENNLLQILYHTSRLSSLFLGYKKGYKVETRLTFPIEWGLGSSSTFLNNISQWVHINPYRLLENTFGGSGYDIACAESKGPVLYYLFYKSIPAPRTIDFMPPFSENLYFVYLNQKQDTREAIAEYKKQKYDEKKVIPEITQITLKVINSKSLIEFADLLEQHEQIMSGVLNLQPVKERLFPDFKGTIKSLGSWGGDFVLAVSQENPTQYFKQKGFETVIPYKKMIL